MNSIFPESIQIGTEKRCVIQNVLHANIDTPLHHIIHIL